jgi:hypothetical protein
VPFADRLAGRAAIAQERIEDGIELLRRASAGFAALGAVWEQARTDLRLAEAGATDAASSAAAIFEELRCVRDAARARALVDGGGGFGPSKLG